MTPKEKAKELVKKYWMNNKNGQDSYLIAIENALICVDEILNNYKESNFENIFWINYWKEVKQEIKKL